MSLDDLGLPGMEVVGAPGATNLLLLASVLVPLWIAAALWLIRLPKHDEQGAIALSVLWNAAWLPAANAIAIKLDWWHFESAGPDLAGLPLPLWVGWSLLWGAAAPLLRIRPPLTLALLLAIDLATMPLLDPAVILGERWLVGEALVLVGVGLPGLLLARWSAEPRAAKLHLRGRVVLQVTLFTNLLLWSLPLAAVTAAGRALDLGVNVWWLGAVLALVGLAALPGVIAVADFELNGGSPWPWDSTDRPVLSGPYRYVRSPMQASAVLVLAASAVIYSDWAIALIAAVTLGYNQLFCRLESRLIADRFGDAWTIVAAHQRRWWPSWRPHPKASTAVLWFDTGCAVCSPVADFLLRFDPVGLDIRCASGHPDRLTQIRYERADGPDDQVTAYSGVAAVGAALEHCNLALAVVGWFLRLPVLWRLWQLVADAVGLGPRPATIPHPNSPITTAP